MQYTPMASKKFNFGKFGTNWVAYDNANPITHVANVTLITICNLSFIYL